MRNLLLLLPDEAIPLLFVAGALAIIVGARRTGGSLIVLSITLTVLPVLLAPLFDLLPTGVLMLLLVLTFIGLVFGMLRWLSVALIGQRATEHMVGTLAAGTSFGHLCWAACGLPAAPYGGWRGC